jgi:hypothetical protein
MYKRVQDMVSFLDSLLLIIFTMLVDEEPRGMYWLWAFVVQ